MSPSHAQQPATFDDHLTRANTLFTQDKLAEALAALQAAGRTDAKRFEAPALAALVLHKAGRPAEAKQALADARKLAPADKQAKLDAIERLIAAAPVPAAASAAPTAPVAGVGQLTGALRRRYDALMLIIEEAEAATPIEARRKLLAEFLAKSADFVRDQPAHLQMWMLRATAALELSHVRAGRAAAQAIIKLGGDDSADPKLRKLLVTLERKGWLGDQAAGPAAGMPFENSLGMKFVPVPEVLFGVWDVRVQDYEKFARETRREWPKPSFEQGSNHPAVNVSWDDAKAFCAWLTEKERNEGRLSAEQSYRLPQDWEWSVAVGLNESRGGTPQSKDMKTQGVYSWGTQFPPPRGTGNYAGEESDYTAKIAGYNDGFARTSPVGSFAANRLGLFDMGGNIWQWCEDFFDGSSGARVLRGASFGFNVADYLLSSYRDLYAADGRYGFFGFRCVVAVSGASPP